MIDAEIFGKPLPERGVKFLVVVTAIADHGDIADMVLAFRSPVPAKDEDTVVLHARHPSDIFLADMGQDITGGGVRSGQIRFFFELPATCDGIDPNRVVLEELGGHK